MSNNEEYIGNNIREIRLKIGLSQNKLADKCGISNTVLSNYETGKKIPGLKTLATIATALKVSMDRLYYGDESKSFITSQPDKGRKIVHAVYFLWKSGIVSYYENRNPSPNMFPDNTGLQGIYLYINKYPIQIGRLITDLDNYRKNISTYDDPDIALEVILSSVANEINKIENSSH